MEFITCFGAKVFTFKMNQVMGSGVESKTYTMKHGTQSIAVINQFALRRNTLI
jgi:hypothetical protein